MEDNQNWKNKVILAGALIGLITGIGAAYLYVKKADELPERPKLTTGDGMKLGMGLVGVLKLISEFGTKTNS
jgi:hypothetical protein